MFKNIDCGAGPSRDRLAKCRRVPYKSFVKETMMMKTLTLDVSENVGHMAVWTGAMEQWPHSGEKQPLLTHVSQQQ